MKKGLMFKSMIIGMENLGARYVKTDSTHVFFDIPKDSVIDDDMLKRSKEAFTSTFGLGLKVRRLK